MSRPPKSLRCPTCRQVVSRTDEQFPFCSDRCRLIDLGKWASGAYRVSSPILDPEVLEDLDQQKLKRSSDDSEDPEEKTH